MITASTDIGILQAVIVNHVAVDMAVSPDRLWASIFAGFAGYGAWIKAGYEIEEYDDPTASLAYRMKLEKDGAIVDERVVRVTEQDQAARRVSLFADFLSEAHGLNVFASYQARETADGSCYTIDCHTRMGIETPGDGGRSAVAAKIAELEQSFATYLVEGLVKLKAKLEAEEAAANTAA
jgi:hypothetical protein